jgi:BolA family transcriptional regulator, general stress-responsive regulator
MGKITEQLKRKLETTFNPLSLEIIDDSDKHKGHSGARSDGESHFSVVIVSEAFSGLNQVARQRLVNKALAEELKGAIHALSLKTLSPDEVA